jgi:hypothetical protein
MLRRPGYNGRSKASADTLCQKCLARGHYSYECKAPAQERPYKSRPSRTQQLLNPQLKPKLTAEVPQNLVRKKGIADEILAKKEAERGRISGRDSSRKRPRSVSTYSDDSVSTISTNRSRSRSPQRIHRGKTSLRGGDSLGKRPRHSVSSPSLSSPERAERNTRRRMSSFSPAERGRRRTRSRSSRMDLAYNEKPMRKARRHLSRSRSRESYGFAAVRPHSPSRSSLGSPNRMDTSDDHAPQYDGQMDLAPGRRRGASPGGSRPSRSQTRSPYRRGSPSLYNRRPVPPLSSYRDQDSNGGRAKRLHHIDQESPRLTARMRSPPVQPAPQRQRSLSPFSKRVALTKQLNQHK